MLNKGQGERGRFAGSGLRQPQQVLVPQQQRDAGGLDGSGGLVLQVLQLVENGSRQAKLPECSRYHVCGCVCECAPAAMN